MSSSYNLSPQDPPVNLLTRRSPPPSRHEPAAPTQDPSARLLDTDDSDPETPSSSSTTSSGLVALQTFLDKTRRRFHQSGPHGAAYGQWYIRFARYVLTLTIVITTILLLQLKNGLPPRALVSEVPDQVWFTDKFNLTIPQSLGANIALWNTEDTRKDKAVPVIAEFHTHTTFSDGAMSPAQVVDWAIAYGYNVLFVTDHNTLEGGLKAQEYALRNRSAEIHVVPGIEYTCCRIHMNLVGLKEQKPKKKKSYLTPPSKWPSDEELQLAIQETHERGGLVFVNHIPWSLSTEYGRQVPTIQIHPTLEQLVAWGVDGFEVVSEGTLDLPTLRFVEKHGMPYVTATDLHAPDVAPTAWTVLNMARSTIPPRLLPRFANESAIASTPPPTSNYTELLASANAFSDAIVDLLRARAPSSTNFYYAPIGPAPRVYPVDNARWDWYAPLAALDFTYFWSESKGMYSFVDGFCHERVFTFHYTRVAAFIFWAALLFVIVEAASTLTLCFYQVI